MPVLIHAIAKNFNELLENSRLTAVALLCECGGVMVVAVDVAFVFVVRVLCAKDSGTNAAGEMLNVILAIECCDIRSTQRTTACEAQQIKASEIIGFAERILFWSLVGHWKEL